MKPFRRESMKQIAEVRPFTRKNEFQKVIGSLEESAHSLTEGWSRGRMVKAGLIAGGFGRPHRGKHRDLRTATPRER
jgi:hypothetical protein